MKANLIWRLRRIVKAISVLVLMAMLPIALVLAGAAGPTSDDIAAGRMIAWSMLAYIVLDIVTLFLLIRFPRQKLMWIWAAVLAAIPVLLASAMTV